MANISGAMKEDMREFNAMRELREQLVASQEKSERLLLEVQIHAQEARTANATIAEIYRAITGGKGESGNLLGAQLVIDYITTSQLEVQRLRDALELYRGQIANDGASGYAENYLSTHSDLSALREHEARVTREIAIQAFNSGYEKGHNDTVEGSYVDIHPSDMSSYHVEEVSVMIAWLAQQKREAT